MNEVCTRINKMLRRSFKLKKLDLSFNYLRTRLFSLMRGIFQPLEYLNLQDCRLDSTDIAYLNTMSMLKSLRLCKELNLSMNDFSQSYSIVFSIIANCTQLNCLSISYCQIPIEFICQHLVTRIFLNSSKKKSILENDSLDETDQSSSFTKLKVIYLQPFTPPKMHEILGSILIWQEFLNGHAFMGLFIFNFLRRLLIIFFFNLIILFVNRYFKCFSV